MTKLKDEYKTKAEIGLPKVKKIFFSLLFLSLFLIVVPLTYADHNVDFNVEEFSAINSSNITLPDGSSSTTPIIFTDTVDGGDLATCNLIDNSDNAVIDSNEIMHDYSGNTWVAPNFSLGVTPPGWTALSTYHLVCTKTNNTVIESEDFRYLVSPEVIGVSQNFNIISVYFASPQLDSFLPSDPNEISNDSLPYNPFMSLTASDWFDNLNAPEGNNLAKCQENVTYNDQNASVCNFDLYVNPNLPNTNKALFNIGFYDNNIQYEAQSINMFSVIAIKPHLTSLSNTTISAGSTYTASGSFSNTSPIATGFDGQVNYGESGYEEMPLDGTNFSLNHVYATPGTYTINACVVESLQGTGPTTGCSTATITVTAPLQISPLNGGTINQGDTYTEDGSFSDPNQNITSWTGTVDYGDGSGSQLLTLNSDNTFSLNRQYTVEGTYTVTVNITDDQGRTGTTTTTVIVNPGAPTTLSPIADTYIKNGSKNDNEGASPMLTVQNSGNKRALVQFDESQIQAAVGSSTNYTATLQFTISDSSNLSNSGRQIDLFRMVQPWAEGNGYITGNSMPDKGTGSGATWNCATDSNISNGRTDCSGSDVWDMIDSGSWPFVSTPTATTTITKNETGTVSFDVTSDVQSFLSGANTNDGWIVKLDNESQSGNIDFGSKESGNAPQLIITRQ